MNVTEAGIAVAVPVDAGCSVAPVEHAVSNPSTTIADDPARNALMRFAMFVEPFVRLAAKSGDVNQLFVGIARQRGRYGESRPATARHRIVRKSRRAAIRNGFGLRQHSVGEWATAPTTERGAHIMSNTVTPSWGKAARWTVIAGAALAFAAAPNASANPPILPTPGDGPASTAVQELQSAGYNVSINWLEGHPNVPLSECKVTSISGLRVTMQADGMTLMEPARFDTAYVDISCPNAK
ncbi:hypothetical protein [Mycolicibacterium sp. NCC-Tsukiji]|uniref:hypothetical protein n=1 Tax=Mycolicibacterium sp. NCC-Tsukiji TaxID=2185272 RepID=UPI00107F2492|nr:hypothetical protein [Mycolicibacterium sp. NCC-Tsukiji]